VSGVLVCAVWPVLLLWRVIAGGWGVAVGSAGGQGGGDQVAAIAQPALV
jgi:hypothetical protein